MNSPWDVTFAFPCVRTLFEYASVHIYAPLHKIRRSLFTNSEAAAKICHIPFVKNI